ncbi:hypothetical protein BJV85_002945 [Clostridium acetobutylicum]|uniref:hypothetical protein n=1 Tax=Clostridium TaxID=1485 RepID=UPI000200A692|nr:MULTISPECIES: hypothetical protein [Clostridium]ADZ20109.1 Exopolyphosphatase-like domain and PAS domain containing protein [Clostridium acetobutylicum EA 2018]AEI31584.1 Exopolyphosphatase-like domain and PAS domain protein [Clostridium acetobutylicum DSM 1731]AWV81710.1 exopolyphosphatase [Clostridium acetobutylicum]MBC2395251.1 exopolyphosphatase [Clostridium acetobutylicum]MBC2585401.1 exopolyphosphatase [Clostridium acetobutylicum]
MRDLHSKIGLAVTLSIGVGTVAAGPAGNISITNANSIFDLRGWGKEFGGSFNKFGPKLYSLEVEVHMDFTYTWILIHN